MVWRLYAVWGNNLYICIIPVSFMFDSTLPSGCSIFFAKILIVLATAGTGYATVAGFLHASASNIFAVLNTYTATWALSVTTQTSTSLAIMGRIWWITRNSPKSLGWNRYFAIAWIIVESGVIYSLTTILLLIFYDLRTNFGGIINIMLAQTCVSEPSHCQKRVLRILLSRQSFQPWLSYEYAFAVPINLLISLHMGPIHRDNRQAQPSSLPPGGWERKV